MSAGGIRESIRRKRDGAELMGTEIGRFVAGVVNGSIPSYQAAAMLMAVYLRGMSDAELAALCAAMIESGDRLQILSEAPKVDKHSTGGVGDKVSIALAPLVAACGVTVPMMSGRGLGHTGGTLDKLESISGFRTALSPAEFSRIAGRHGVIIAGQSDRIVPADRVLYALRDSTATVSSVPLISSSIMSKKLVEGLDALILDVKVGAGAFMETTDEARLLARTMVGIGRAHRVETRAILTDMSRPLGREVGNANEVAEAIAVLRGEGPADLAHLVRTLGIAMLDAGGLDGAPERIDRSLGSGDALAKLAEMVEAQGGDPAVVEHPERLPRAAHAHPVKAARRGFVASIDARTIGRAAMGLGAGRATMEDRIDHAAGITLAADVGDEVQPGDLLATLRFNDPSLREPAAELVRNAYAIADAPPGPRVLILEEIRDAGG